MTGSKPLNTGLVISSDNKVITIGKPIGGTNSNKPIEKGNKVDILFVIDTTGSMDDKISALLETCKQFVDEARSLKLDPNFALVSFGDISYEGGGDRIEIVVQPTANIERIKNGLTNIPRNNGFGNEGESSMEALEKTMTIGCRSSAVKIIVLITDEPALQHSITASSMTAKLKSKEYLVFAVATHHEYYKHMAKQTGGFWRDVTSTRNLKDILDMFRNIAKKATQIAKNVHQVADGSVSKYLQLNPPKDE